MFCKYCGSALDDDSVFCASCGKRVVEDIARYSQENQSSAAKSDTDTGISAQNKDNPQNDKKWYFYTSDDKKGPFTVNDLKVYIHTGALTSSTRVISST